MKARLALLLVCLACLSCTRSGASRPLGEVPIVDFPGPRDTFMPRYVDPRPALGPKAVGLILTDRTWDVNGKPQGGAGFENEVDFYTGGPSAFCLYLPGRVPPKAGPKELQLWHVSEPFTLVEVKVNGGQGLPAGRGDLVTTGVQPVEGTSAYPLRVTPVYRELKARYLQYLAQHQGELDQALQGAQREALGNEPLTGPPQTLLYHRLDWLSDTAQLDVRFLTQIQGGAYYRREGLAGAMTHQTWTEGRGFQVELGMEYLVARDGSLVATRRLPIAHTRTQCSPPPSRPGLPRP